MGDDRLPAVDDVYELSDHAVRVNGRFVGGQLGSPAGFPTLVLAAELGLNRRALAAAAGAMLRSEFFEQGTQHEGRVAQQGHVGDVILVEIARVERGMHDPLTAWNLGSKDRSREARSDGEDGVTPLERIADHVVASHAARAEREGMTFVEALLPRSVVITGAARYSATAVSSPAAGVEHALPRPDHRPLRLEQEPGCVANGQRIGADTGRHNGAIIPRLGDRFAGDVDGNLEQHGTRSPQRNRVNARRKRLEIVAADGIRSAHLVVAA